MEIQELQEASRHTIKRFKMVEPREWGMEGTLVELIGEIGSLAHCTMIYEKYKRGTVNVAKIKDETSDVLFVIFKLADVCGIELPNRIEIRPVSKTLSALTIDLSSHLGLIIGPMGNFQKDPQDSASAAIVGPTLVSMICILGQIADLVGYSLEDAHRTELKIAELWLDTQVGGGKHYINLVPKIIVWLARPLANFLRKIT